MHLQKLLKRRGHINNFFNLKRGYYLFFKPNFSFIFIKNSQIKK